MSQRINQFLAQACDLSRRAADAAIQEGRVTVNGQPAQVGAVVDDNDVITLDGKQLESNRHHQLVILNKPVGYVCSRNGQGKATIYELLPTELHHLNPVGRLDKNSSGLLLLTNDGQLAHQLTHPSFGKDKVYHVRLHRDLTRRDEQQITTGGVSLHDGSSTLHLKPLTSSRRDWQVTMHEGRNRQIRRTFAALDYEVIHLHRISFGSYQLGDLELGKYRIEN